MHSHYFIAVPLPTEIKKELKRTFKKESYPFKRWVHKEDLHLTLVFLGACTNEQLEYINQNGQKILSDMHPFSLQLSSLGTYGKKTEPRIFWMGVKDQPKLHDLRNKVYELCEEAGFVLEKRPFSPHITLARKWVGLDSYNEEGNSVNTLQLEWKVENIILYKSVLTEEPKYKEIYSFSLTGDRE